MIQVCPLEWQITNKQKERWIPDANQWSYTNLLKQNGISEATQWSYTNLHRQRNKRRIPDTNRWIYTSLLKQNRISDATQWTYTNLHRRKQEMGYEMWKSTANLSGLRLTPQMLIGNPMPHYRDLQWILTYKNKSNQ